MLTLDQAAVVRSVFMRFNENEIKEWTKLDECMVYLSWISDEQLVTETEILVQGHMNANARCIMNHTQDQCFVPTVLDAINHIVSDYNAITEKKRLAKKARYVLEYYLSLTYVGEIITD